MFFFAVLVRVRGEYSYKGLRLRQCLLMVSSRHWNSGRALSFPVYFDSHARANGNKLLRAGKHDQGYALSDEVKKERTYYSFDGH